MMIHDFLHASELTSLSHVETGISKENGIALPRIHIHC